MKKDLAINQFLHYSLGMSNTYLASEVSPEEYTAALAEAAELALADYHAHLDQLEAQRQPDDSDWNYYPEDDYNEYTMG